MNPFDQPPTEPPVSTEPPVVPPGVAGHGAHDGPRRGRMALAALAAAGLVGGGVVVVGHFASADRPSLGASAATDEPAPDEPAPDEPAPDEPAPDEPMPDEPATEPGAPSIDGEIVIDDGEGEPFVLDLGELSACLDPIFRRGPMFDHDMSDHDGEWNESTPPPFEDDFHRRMEEFLETLPWDDLGDLGIDAELLDDGVRIFGSGGSTVTVVGPDGVEVIDLGEGDATITIEQRGGELSVETDGDATVGGLDLGELDLGELDLGELDLGELDLGEWRDRMPFDLDEIESCLDDVVDDTD